MPKHVHGFWEVIQVDFLATDNAILLSIKHRQEDTPYELEVVAAVEEEPEQ